MCEMSSPHSLRKREQGKQTEPSEFSYPAKSSGCFTRLPLSFLHSHGFCCTQSTKRGRFSIAKSLLPTPKPAFPGAFRHLGPTGPTQRRTYSSHRAHSSRLELRKAWLAPGLGVATLQLPAPTPPACTSPPVGCRQPRGNF